MAYWTNACYWGPALYFESHLASPSWLRRSTNASTRTIYGTALDALRHLPSHADGRGLAIRQNVHDATPFEIADNRSITVPTLPRPIIGCYDRGVERCSGARARTARSNVSLLTGSNRLWVTARRERGTGPLS